LKHQKNPNKRHKIDSKFSTSYVGTCRKHSGPMRLFSLRREGGLHNHCQQYSNTTTNNKHCRC
jgi:hypothetical protein